LGDPHELPEKQPELTSELVDDLHCIVLAVDREPLIVGFKTRFGFEKASESVLNDRRRSTGFFRRAWRSIARWRAG
jgi:hypothetical protein